MFNPQDLPGRYGHVVKAVDRLLAAVGCEAALAGGWAVWRHGFVGRVTQDMDIVLAKDKLEEFLRTATVSGFDLLPQEKGRWPKLLHKETGIKVDILPQGERPGTSARPAPTTIPHPSVLGASGHALAYLSLAGLIELKLAAGRTRDESDVVELIRANEGRIATIRRHLAEVHPAYAAAFERLLETARQEEER